MQALYRSSGFKMLVWSKLLVFTGKKLAFRVFFFNTYLNIGPSPTSTLRPPPWWMRPGLPSYSLCLPLLCIILDANWRTKTGGGLGMRLGLTGYVHSSSRPTCRHSSLTNYYTEYIHHYPIIHWISFSRSPSEATDTIITLRIGLITST